MDQLMVWMCMVSCLCLGIYAQQTPQDNRLKFISKILQDNKLKSVSKILQDNKLVFLVFCLADKVEFVNKKPINHHDPAQYRDCDHLRRSGGYTTSGVYRLHLSDTHHYQTWCEHAAGISFTVIQRRMYGNENFARGIADYMHGFGHPQGDYWLGLNSLYYLTHQRNYMLNITMMAWDGEIRTATYRIFRLLDPTYYTLQIGGFHGNVPDDLAFNNNMPFSTVDRPDRYNCVAGQGAGWWYNYCSFALPNGFYYYGGVYPPRGGFYDGIYWKDWRGYNYSLKFISMSVAPN